MLRDLSNLIKLSWHCICVHNCWYDDTCWPTHTPSSVLEKERARVVQGQDFIWHELMTRNQTCRTRILVGPHQLPVLPRTQYYLRYCTD